MCKRKIEFDMSIRNFFINISDTLKKLVAEGEEIQRQKEIKIQENISSAGEHFLTGYGKSFTVLTNNTSVFNVLFLLKILEKLFL